MSYFLKQEPYDKFISEYKVDFVWFLEKNVPRKFKALNNKAHELERQGQVRASASCFNEQNVRTIRISAFFQIKEAKTTYYSRTSSKWYFPACSSLKISQKIKLKFALELRSLPSYR